MKHLHITLEEKRMKNYSLIYFGSVTVQVLQPQDLNSYLRWKVSNQDLDKVRETL